MRGLRQAARTAVEGVAHELDAARFDAVLLERFGHADEAESAVVSNVDGPLDASETAVLVLPEYGASLWFTDPLAEAGQGMSTHGLPQDDQFDALFGFSATSPEDA